MAPRMVAVSPHLFGRAVCVLSSVTIVVALFLTQYMPKRFRIHPYPYLSDAGLRDPERIVISYGLALSSALFLPVAIGLYLHQQSQLETMRSTDHRFATVVLPRRGIKRQTKVGPFTIYPFTVRCDAVPRRGLQAGVGLAFFLSLFTAIPGWFFFHHIFALAFALSAAAWSTAHVIFTHARLQNGAEQVSQRLSRRLSLMYSSIGIQGGVVLFFGVIWGSVKAEIPYKMIPNKDPRFIVLAFLEYIGTAAFVGFIALVCDDLRGVELELSLRTQALPLQQISTSKEVEGIV